MRLEVLALAVSLVTCIARAEMPADPDWKEVEAPPAPAVRTDGLIPLDVTGSSLRFGVDPASISVGPDDIVRYVVVASSRTGTVNALYEGIRCGTGEFKVYARHNPDTGWTLAKDPLWRSLHEQPISRHTLEIARTGACVGHGTNSPASRIVRDLRSPVDTRLRGN